VVDAAPVREDVILQTRQHVLEPLRAGGQRAAEALLHLRGSSPAERHARLLVDEQVDYAVAEAAHGLAIERQRIVVRGTASHGSNPPKADETLLGPGTRVDEAGQARDDQHPGENEAHDHPAGEALT